MRFRRAVVAVTAVLALAVASGCNDSQADGGGPSLQKLNYLTSFNTFGREAYAYVALEKGYFREAGYDVTITPGSGTVDVLKLVAGGQADYGVVDFTGAVITLAGQKLPVTTVGVVHQKSLAAIVALEGGSINKPEDLAGKQIGDQPGSTNQLMFPVYARAAKIDASKTKFVASPPPALPQLLAAGTVDGIGQFVVGAPLVEKADKQKRKAVVLPYGNLVPDLYGITVATRSDLAKEHPDQVKKFTTALFRGLQDTIDDPAAAAATMKKYVPNLDVEVATRELELMKPYVKPDNFEGAVGEVDPARVQKVINLLEQAGAVKPDADLKPADLVNDALAPKG